MSNKKRPAWTGRVARDCQLWDIRIKDIAAESGMLPQSISRIMRTGSCTDGTKARILGALNRLVQRKKEGDVESN